MTLLSAFGTLLGLILVLGVENGKGAPAPYWSRKDVSRKDPNSLLKAMNYLMTFNYMSTGALVSGVQRNLNSQTHAIKKFQTFANLRVTGQLDDETLQKMAEPRCGIPDVIWSGDTRRRKRYAFQGTRWTKKQITWTILDYTPDVYYRRNQENAIRMAFELWRKASKLTFVQTTDPNADIRISFKTYFHNDGNPFDGAGGVLAHAFYPYDSINAIAGDMHFDEDETWSTTGESGKIDLFQVAAHELGHSLGLAHSSTPGALMLPFYAGYKDPSSFTLPNDDTRAIQALYGVPEIIRPVTSKPGVIKPPRGAPDPCTTRWTASVMGRDKRTYAFMGGFVASINNERIDDGYPKPLVEVFPYLRPRNGRIEAGVTTSKGHTYLFSGDQYWIYYGQTRANQPFAQIRGSTNVRSTFSSNFPIRMDSLMLWSGNGFIYAFRGTQYWRLTSNLQVARGYPRAIKPVWKGIPIGMDASVTWKNGRTYFFKGSKFWRFNNHKLRLSKNYPKDISTGWIGCGIRKSVGRAVDGTDLN